MGCREKYITHYKHQKELIAYTTWKKKCVFVKPKNKDFFYLLKKVKGKIQFQTHRSKEK